MIEEVDLDLDYFVRFSFTEESESEANSSKHELVHSLSKLLKLDTLEAKLG